MQLLLIEKKIQGATSASVADSAAYTENQSTVALSEQVVRWIHTDKFQCYYSATCAMFFLRSCEARELERGPRVLTEQQFAYFHQTCQ